MSDVVKKITEEEIIEGSVVGVDRSGNRHILQRGHPISLSGLVNKLDDRLKESQPE